MLTRLNGVAFVLNPDLVERADQTPDTVVTLVDGTKYVVTESLDEFVSLVLTFRARVISQAQCLTGRLGGLTSPDDGSHSEFRGHHGDHAASVDGHAKVLPLHPKEH
jgi:flagellar protein FlbD